MFAHLSSSLLWRGILGIVVGVISVAWPGITITAFVILFAVYAFLAAGTDVSRAFSGGGVGRVAGYVLLALISVAAGIGALVWPGITALALTLWVAAWALATGVFEVALAFRPRESTGERALWSLSGLISIGLGVVLAIRPDLGALTLATVFGLFSIVHGVSSLVLAARTRALTAGEGPGILHPAM
jgi:uncharacterized membrane protein HdeD (DUF308 family)